MKPENKYLVRKPKVAAQPTGSLHGDNEQGNEQVHDSANPQDSNTAQSADPKLELGMKPGCGEDTMKAAAVKVKVEPSDRHERSRSPHGRLIRQGSDTTLILGSSACYCSSSSEEKP